MALDFLKLLLADLLAQNGVCLVTQFFESAGRDTGKYLEPVLKVGFPFLFQIVGVAPQGESNALEDKNCIKGVAMTSNGLPAAGMNVTVQGEDYLGGSYATTDNDGSYCVNVKRGSTNTLSIWGGDKNGYYSWSDNGIQVADTPTDCTLGNCLDLGEQTMTALPITCIRATLSGFPSWFWIECQNGGCISGRVLDKNGAEIAWVDGEVADPGASSTEVCFTVPTGSTFEINMFCDSQGQNQFTMTNPNASCAEGACQDIGQLEFCQDE